VLAGGRKVNGGSAVGLKMGESPKFGNSRIFGVVLPYVLVYLFIYFMCGGTSDVDTLSAAGGP